MHQQLYIKTFTMPKITVEQQKRMNSVLQQNTLISKPDKPNDKCQQTGRHLTATRGLPDMLACPQLDPVNGTNPTPPSSIQKTSGYESLPCVKIVK